jgi:cell division septal protein FtsQ
MASAKRGAVLSPRSGSVELADLGSRGRLIGGQRIDAARLRRRVARRARWVVGRLLLAAGGLVVLAGAAFGASWAFRSPRFAVQSVEVTGTERMSPEQIAAAASIPQGISLFALDARDAVSRLEALPLVRRAEVIRSLPNRVTVVVEERRPFALVNAGRLHWVDEEGVDLGLEPRAVALGAPVLSGLKPDDLGSGGHRSASDRAAFALSLLRLLLRAQGPLLGQISEIDMSRPEWPLLYTVDGIEVRLGSDDWGAQLGRLQGVLQQLAATGESVASIDLRFRDQVVLKPR